VTQPTLFGPPPIPASLDGDALRVAALLYDVRPAKVTSDELCLRLGWPIERAADVRHICSSLADDFGLWVCGDRSQRTGGYWLSESYEEYVAAQMPGLRQALTTLRRIRRRVGDKRVRTEMVRLGLRAVFEDLALTKGR